MDAKVAYLSQGRLFVISPDGSTHEIISPYGESVRRRAVEIEQRNAWKVQGRGAQFARGGAPWGIQGGSAIDTPVAITGVARGPNPGTFYYSLQAGDVSGLFIWEDDSERRLIHSEKYVVRDLDARSGKAICTLDFGFSSNLALFDLESLDWSEVTEGDSRDSNASWIDSDSFVYQSSGVARNSSGHAIGFGSSRIFRMDLKHGSLTEFAFSVSHDFLTPRVAPDGSIFCIRRPYSPPGTASSGVFSDIKAAVIAPFRLVRAVWAFLNMFSKAVTGEGLTPAGGPSREGPDQKQMLLLGNLVNAEEAHKAAILRGENIPGLVPTTWELVRHTPDGWQVIQPGVVAFDFTSTGDLIWSNGRGVFLLSDALKADNPVERLVRL